jgi:hypothetical protein
MNLKKINTPLQNDINSKILYNLNRFFFLFFPFNLLIIKIIGVSQFTVWKELIIIINIFSVVFYLKDHFLNKYIALVIMTFLIDIALNRFSIEYILWLSAGFPIYNYFKQANVKDLDNDIRIIIILVCLGAFWIYFFESSGNYGYFFVAEKEDFTLVRGEGFRMRYCFVSPMALSQFSWFTLICVNINPRYTKAFKIICSVLLGYILVVANTRAGYLLLAVSVLTFVYSYFYKVKKWIVFGFVIVCSIVIIEQMLINSVADSETSLSDALRFVRIQNGIASIQSNWLFGMGGEYFSPRSDYFIKISNFENSWLSLIYSFGTSGLILLFMLVYKLGANISYSNYKFLCLSISWLLYSILFPILQEGIPIYITWSIIAFSCHYEKFDFFLKDIKLKNRRVAVTW